MVDEVLEFAGIRSDHDLGHKGLGYSLDELAPGTLVGIGRTLASEKPDWVVVQVDTNSAMTGALAAHHQKNPVCHVEAGLRTGHLHNPWPEEGNRKLIGVIARLYCAPAGRQWQPFSGKTSPRAQFITPETMWWMRSTGPLRLEAEPSLAPQLDRFLRRFAGRQIIAVTCHRRENWDVIDHFVQAVEQLANRDDVAIILPAHPIRVYVHFAPACGAGQRSALGSAAISGICPVAESARAVLTDSGGCSGRGVKSRNSCRCTWENCRKAGGIRAGSGCSGRLLRREDSESGRDHP